MADQTFMEWLHELTTIAADERVFIEGKDQEEVRKYYEDDISPEIALILYKKNHSE